MLDRMFLNKGSSSSLYWIATLGGAGTDVCFDMAIDSSGNAYLTGYVYGNNIDVIIAKYNSFGDIQWQRSLGGSVEDVGNGIAVDNSGNVYVTGYTNSQTAGNTDLLVTKYDTSGVIQWQRTLGGTAADSGAGIAVDSSGNIYITGGVASSGGSGSNDLLVVKYDTNGSIQWQRSLGGTLSDGGSRIALDLSGNIYIVGSVSSSGGAGSSDILIVKYDNSGVIQWQRSLGAGSADGGSGIAVDNSGNVYITGYATGQGFGNQDVIIAKYDSSGVIQWQRILGGTGADYGIGIAVDSSNNIYIVGRTTSQGAGNQDILIAKYDSSGTIQWQRTLGGASNDIGFSVKIDGNGRIYIAGHGTSQGAGADDILIAKLPGDGSLTGAYGNLTYAASTLSESASGLTDKARSLIDRSRSLTNISRTLTDSALTLTSSVISL